MQVLFTIICIRSDIVTHARTEFVMNEKLTRKFSFQNIIIYNYHHVNWQV